MRQSKIHEQGIEIFQFMTVHYGKSPQNLLEFKQEISQCLEQENQLFKDRLTKECPYSKFDKYFQKITKQKQQLTIKYCNGTMKQGHITNKELNGFGIFKTTNGSIYQGFWINGVQFGYGRSVNFDGSLYLGEITNFKREGFGIWKLLLTARDFQSYDADAILDQTNYQGFWKAGEFHGYGKYIRTSGDIYEGIFQNYRLNGYGVKIPYRGVILEGRWTNGELVEKTKISQYSHEEFRKQLQIEMNKEFSDKSVSQDNWDGHHYKQQFKICGSCNQQIPRTQFNQKHQIQFKEPLMFGLDAIIFGCKYNH